MTTWRNDNLAYLTIIHIFHKWLDSYIGYLPVYGKKVKKVFHLPLSLNSTALILGNANRLFIVILQEKNKIFFSSIILPLYRYLLNKLYLYSMRQHFPSKSESLTHISLY